MQRNRRASARDQDGSCARNQAPNPLLYPVVIVSFHVCVSINASHVWWTKKGPEKRVFLPGDSARGLAGKMGWSGARARLFRVVMRQRHDDGGNALLLAIEFAHLDFRPHGGMGHVDTRQRDVLAEERRVG